MDAGGIYDLTVVVDGERLYHLSWKQIKYFYPSLERNMYERWWEYWHREVPAFEDDDEPKVFPVLTTNQLLNRELLKKYVDNTKLLDPKVVKDTATATSAAKKYYETNARGMIAWKREKEIKKSFISKKKPFTVTQPIDANSQYESIAMFIKCNRSPKTAVDHLGKRYQTYGGIRLTKKGASGPTYPSLEQLSAKDYYGKPLPKFKDDWNWDEGAKPYTDKLEFRKESKKEFLGDWRSIQGIDLHSRYLDDPHPDEYIPGYTEFKVSSRRYGTATDLKELDR